MAYAPARPAVVYARGLTAHCSLLMQILPATPAHAAAIAEIYNHAVEHTTAIWNEALVDADNRVAWMAQRQAAGFPVFVALDEDGSVQGYASFGDFRAFDGYRHSVEHSVYVRQAVRGRGVGLKLMEALIAEARRLGKHVMIGAIESGNTASIRLHATLGFVEVGRMPQVGAKFGRWLDLTLMQLQLDSRPAP
jgi:L-amino acid N-acyltransferase YncA